MKTPTDREISGLLAGIISDGFNRSLAALEKAGAVDTEKLWKHYTGAGSKFYDLVTDQVVLTARYAAPSVRQLFVHDDTTPQPSASTE
jgi:hypothetical protein